MDVRIVDNPASQRLEASVDGLLSLLDYRIDDATLTIAHTEVPAELAGRGIAASLVQRAFEIARERGLRVVLRCAYATAWLRRHPEWTSQTIDGG